MRGGLDEALSKLARRDELRRRAAGQATGTPPAVAELVEAVAAVVARHPELAITMGVEGAGDPVLLQFALEDGVVQVTADNTVAERVPEAAPTSPRHADFDIDLDVADDPLAESDHDPAGTGGSADLGFDPDRGPGPRPEPAGTGFDPRSSYDAMGGYATDSVHEAERPYGVAEPYRDAGWESRRRADHETYELGDYRVVESPTRRLYPPEPVPSPLAATPPPPVPPQSPPRRPGHRPAQARRPGPEPLPTPEPLRFEPEATELAAKRLAALLREDPSLLQEAPPE